MPGRVFVDSNIFIYAKLHSPDVRHSQAVKFLKSLRSEVIISTQVLGEFYNTLCRLKIADKTIQAALREILKDSEQHIITLKTITACWHLKVVYKYSYFDSLILASALESGCSVIYSEDMQHGQVIEKKLTITNPFV